MIITTGFGYYVQNGKIISKYILPKGEHPDLENGISFVEVTDQATLDAVEIYVVPLTAVEAFSDEKFIEDLLGAFSADSNIFPYYSIVKDLASYKNFSAMKAIVAGLLAAEKITQQEVDTLNTVLANQSIVLANF